MKTKILVSIIVTAALASCSTEFDETRAELAQTTGETVTLIVKTSPQFSQRLLARQGSIGFQDVKPLIFESCKGCHQTGSSRLLHVDKFPFAILGRSSTEVASEIKRRINARQGEPFKMPKYSDGMDGLGLAAMNLWLQRGMPGQGFSAPLENFESIRWTYYINDSPVPNRNLVFRREKFQWQARIPVPVSTQFLIRVGAEDRAGNKILPVKRYPSQVELDLSRRPSSVTVTVGE